MNHIPRDMLDKLITRFNTGDEVDRHNALLAELVSKVNGQAPGNCEYSVYPFAFTTSGSLAMTQQILPRNERRKFLQVYAVSGSVFWFNFDTGPTAYTTFDQTANTQLQEFMARAIGISASGNFVSGAFWTSFGGPAPKNEVTVMMSTSAQGLIIEGV